VIRPIKKISVVIFTDLDGTLLNRDTFKFDEIKDYIKSLVNKGIIIIPNTSKTNAELNNFAKELDLNLPFISENGSAIHGLNIINKNLPDEIILAREKELILKIFQKEIPENLRNKCKFITKMEKKMQSKILGLKHNKLRHALTRKYSIPMLFKGNYEQKKNFFYIIKNIGLSLHEGGRVINLCDKVSKVKAMNKVIKILKKTENIVKTIGVGDNYNDLEMLKNSDFPCLVFNDKFLMDTININNCIVSKNLAPKGWQEVVKMALEKIN
tara:strand:+ start:117 stop:923 length:807 start_codon:yes stop_codon:yes gene_type:complete